MYYLVAAIAAYQCLGALFLSSGAAPRAASAALAAGCGALVSLVALAPLGTGGWWSRYGHAFHEEDAPAPEDSFPCADDDDDDGDGCRAAGGGAAHAGGEDGQRAPLLAPRGASGGGGVEAAAKELPSLTTFGMVCTGDFW